MNKQESRDKLLLKLAKDKTHKAQLALAQTLQAQAKINIQHQQLMRFRYECQQQLKTTCNTTMGVLNNHRDFVGQINNMIKQQQDTLSAASLQVATAQKKLVNTEQAKQSIEKLRDKHQALARQKQYRREQVD